MIFDEGSRGGKIFDQMHSEKECMEEALFLDPMSFDFYVVLVVAMALHFRHCDTLDIPLATVLMAVDFTSVRLMVMDLVMDLLPFPPMATLATVFMALDFTSVRLMLKILYTQVPKMSLTQEPNNRLITAHHDFD